MEQDIYVVGDIHGNLPALTEAIENSPIDPMNDILICLGDVCDGGDHTKECIEVLLEFENLIYIIGNHDVWALEWMETGEELPSWWHQGGLFTASSYDHDYESVPEEHKELLRSAKYYFVDEKDRIYVHGGFYPEKPIEEQSRRTFTWNRDLIDYAKENVIEQFNEVFIGHTSTMYYENRTTPVNYNNLWMMDTGAGWEGKVTIMNVETKEFWQG